MSHELIELGPGVYAWLADAPDLDSPNAGVVIAEDGMTVIDTLTTPTQAAPFAAALAELIALPVRRVVYSSSHVGQVGGSTAFPLAAIYGSGQTSDHLDQPPNPAVWKRLHPPFASEFDELTTRPVSHTVAEPAHLCPASIAIPAGGHQMENLVVQVPGANVVFLGAMGSFGVTPAGFDADVERWITGLQAAREWGEIFVPAYGPLGGVEEVDGLIAYLSACITAEGDPAGLEDGPWGAWPNGEFHGSNVERSAMLRNGDPGPPPSLVTMLGL